jgi:O6-methylguanine-DNA--protein-cysteine methyltransferase
MSHFLHQLRNELENRNNAEKRYSNKRRQYNNRRGLIYDRRANSDSKRHQHHKGDHREKMSGIPLDTLSGIKAILENIAANQERLIAIEERKVKAIEKISENVAALSSPAAHALDGVEEHLQLFQDHKPKKRLKKHEDPNRKRVIEIIEEMRGENATYSDIAERLQMENLPTFSGRGKWHAQTIHRLCSD